MTTPGGALIVVAAKDGSRRWYWEASWRHEGRQHKRRLGESWIRPRATEAQAVFVLGCEERRLPSSHAIESSDTLAVEEERRLFYVAATRARDRLVLTTNQERYGSPSAGASRFLTEADLRNT